MAKHKEDKASYIDVTSQNFPEQVLSAQQMVIVDFSSDRSSSCQIFNPEFAAVSEEYQGRVTFAKLDVDTNETLTSQWNVDGIPTLIFFKNGQEINRIKGIVMRDKLRRQVEGALLATDWLATLNTGRTLASLVEELDLSLLGTRVIARFGHRFPLLAKFLDANDKLSIQVYPDDAYARLHEQGKLGKTEFWYVLNATPGASIVHGFKTATSQEEVRQAIQDLTLENLLHEVPVSTGDIIFVPAGTVHAIGKGVLLYELQEYSDLTYRLYDYGRLSSAGIPRELHIERSLDVMHFDKSRHTKMQAVLLQNGDGFTNRCLAACQYFVTCELILHKTWIMNDYVKNKTHDSCIILTALGAEISVRYGETLDYVEKLFKGQTMILPAELGTFCLEGSGTLLYSYVPASEDEVWHEWEAKNGL